MHALAKEQGKAVSPTSFDAKQTTILVRVLHFWWGQKWDHIDIGIIQYHWPAYEALAACLHPVG